MLYIKDLDISFQSKKILSGAQFMAKEGEITIIKGKSGIGKSTFLKALVFEYPCYYVYHHMLLSDLSQEDKQHFIYEKIGFVQQVPQFLDGMKIIDHMKQFENLGFQRQLDLEEVLHIKSMEYKIPKNLSGGERTRASLYLTLMKQPDILILDEPTASLDIHYTQEVIKIIKEYAKNHIVIIATHDYRLIQHGQRIYEIKNYQMNPLCQIDANQDNETYQAKLLRSYKKMSIQFGYKGFRMIMLSLVSLTLIIFIYSSHLSHMFQNQYQEKIDQISSLEFLVYKQKYQGDYYSQSGREYPLSLSEIENMKNIENIEDITMHVDVDYFRIGLDQYIGEANEDNLTVMQLLDQDKLIGESLIEDMIKCHSYNQEMNYDHKMLYQFHEQGILISQSLYSQLSNNDDLKEPMLVFDLLIPQYNATGIAAMKNNEESYTSTNELICVIKRVTLPIKGVLKDNQMLYGLESNANDIYIPNDIYINNIKEFYPSSQQEMYYIEDIEDRPFYDEIPQEYRDKEIIQQITKSPWMSNSVIVRVDNIAHYNEAIAHVKSLGFQVYSGYNDAGTLEILIQDNENIFLLFMISIIVIVYVFYFYLKYLLFIEEKSTRDFLLSLGMTHKESQYIIRKNYVKNFMILALMTSIILRILIEIMVKAQIINWIIAPRMIYFIFIFVMSFVIEVIIPIVLQKITLKKNQVV